jgi:hypothetical protein
VRQVGCDTNDRSFFEGIKVSTQQQMLLEEQSRAGCR